jgi:hypothetical protein
MTRNVLIMYMVALVALAAGAFMLARLRRPLSEPETYFYRITGTMAASLGLVLAIYASFLWSWSEAP